MSLEFLGCRAQWHTTKPGYESHRPRPCLEFGNLGHARVAKIMIYSPKTGDAWRNPFDDYKTLRDEDPVHHVPDNGEGEDYYVFSRYVDVFNASMDGETYTSTNGLTHSYNDMELHQGRELPIVMMDGPEHIELRHIALKRFAPDKLKALEPKLRQFAIEQIDGLIAKGGGDIVEDLFKPIPSLFVSLSLGVPLEDRTLFDDWAWKVASASATGDVMAASDAIGGMVGYFSQLMQERSTEPGDDMITDLVHAELKNGGKLSPEKILGLGFTMVLGGNDTATGLLSGAAQILTENPEQRAKLWNDSDLMKNAIEEFLRLTSPVQGLARTVTKDVEAYGMTIPEGRKVMLLYGSANRDEREYGDDAGVCDISRQFKRHIAFSSGAHTCIGAAGARMQARIILEELQARCPDFNVDAEKGNYAQGHFVRRFESLPFSPNL